MLQIYKVRCIAGRCTSASRVCIACYSKFVQEKHLDPNRGLVTSQVSRETARVIEGVHRQFLAKNHLDSWGLTVVGAQEPYLVASSKFPNGRAGKTKQITLNLDLPNELERFLDNEFDEWTLLNADPIEP